MRVVVSKSGDELQFGSVATAHAARVAPIIVGRVAAGIALGVIAGIVAFVVPYTMGVYASGGLLGYAMWLLLPAFAVLGAVAFGFAGFRLGTSRAATYLLLDTGYMAKLLEALFDRIMARAANTSIAEAIDGSVQEAICNDDDLSSDGTMAGNFVARLKARVYRMAKQQLESRLVGRDPGTSPRDVVVDEVVGRIRGYLHDRGRSAAIRFALAATAVFVAIPVIIAVLG